MAISFGGVLLFSGNFIKMADYNNFIAGIGRIAPGGVLIHSDLRWGFPFELQKGKEEEFLAEHCGALADLFGDIPIFMPAFNYHFLSQKRFDVQHSPSEVGVLTEYFRQHVAVFRTKDPVFSICGSAVTPYWSPIVANALVDPFGSDSFFQYLYDSDSLLFHYGSELGHTTLLHFIERKLGEVPYRYDKIFEGCVWDGGDEACIRYLYHVRPRDTHLGYAWGKIADDLMNAGIFMAYKNDRTALSYTGVRAMTDFLVEKLERDPFYLLDEESTAWVIPAIRKLNRNLLLQDFE